MFGAISHHRLGAVQRIDGGMDDLLNTGWLLSWKATPTLPKPMHSGDGILQDLHAFSQNPFPHPSCRAFWPQLQRRPPNSSACVPQTQFYMFAEFLFSDILYMSFETHEADCYVSFTQNCSRLVAVKLPAGSPISTENIWSLLAISAEFLVTYQTN